MTDSFTKTMFAKNLFNSYVLYTTIGLSFNYIWPPLVTPDSF